MPVIGGAFKDTADTLVGCSIVVKNAVGAVGLAGFLLIVSATLMPPFLQQLMGYPVFTTGIVRSTLTVREDTWRLPSYCSR